MEGIWRGYGPPERFPLPKGLHSPVTDGFGQSGAGGAEQRVDARGVGDGPPGIAEGIEADEAVAGKERDFDAVEEGADGVIAAAHRHHGQVCLLALLGEVVCGASFGLGVGCDDVPAGSCGTATARRWGCAVVLPRILLGAI